MYDIRLTCDARAGRDFRLNYYEEFGVGPNASTEEIRRAYKILARLLHPDAQFDENLRVAADREMKRLNEMLGVLTDPRRRREYDGALRGAMHATFARTPRRVAPVPADGAWRQMAARYWYAILIAATCIAGWIAYALAASPPEFAPAERAARHESAGGSPFRGRWSSPEDDPGRVECVLDEEAEVIRGTVRVRDGNPARPDVNLEVSGAPRSARSARMAWTAGDGAAGVIDLTLESPDRMRASWWTVKEGRGRTPARWNGWLWRQESR